jgi:hypothetical protein
MPCVLEISRIGRKKMTGSSFLPIAFVFLLAPILAIAECDNSLTEACENLEKHREAEALQQAVNYCQEIATGECTELLGEEDCLVVERFYHSFADSLLRLAQKMDDPQTRTTLKVRALAGWEQYFAWLRNLPEDDRNKIMTSPKTKKGKKIWTAAAAIGISALAAAQPESACHDYELLEPEWLGSDALNWWLASLIYPDQPENIGPTIFDRVANEPELIRRHSADPKSKAHWNAFIGRVRELASSGRFGTTTRRYVDRIDKILQSQSSASPPIRR